MTMYVMFLIRVFYVNDCMNMYAMFLLRVFLYVNVCMNMYAMFSIRVYFICEWMYECVCNVSSRCWF